MKVLARAGEGDIARVYLAQTDDGRLIEFAESLQPNTPIDKKWVLCISTLFGCPVNCRMCDAGGSYEGRLSAQEMLAQIDYLIRLRFPEGVVAVEKFKVQFARMGEPAFNSAVLDLLGILPDKFNAPGLIPSFSTIAPEGTDRFFERLKEIKNRLYPGHFQFQFSLHTTDPESRRWLIPVKTWSFAKMARFGESFREPGDRKITLNFAWAQGQPMDSAILLDHFDPEIFLIKITPVNPTFKAVCNGLVSVLPENPNHESINALRAAGYEVILSIGDLRENSVGSNCGQYVSAYQRGGQTLSTAYQCSLTPV
jgi:23S rRNA (adenine2503-C2)-methyltransferase